MLKFDSPARLFVLFTSLAVALTVPARAFAQAPTFNTLVTTYTNASFNFPNGATAGDFNGDSKLDVFVPDNGAIRMMLGNGNGSFTEHDLGIQAGGNIRAADLNGDGRLDAVVVRPQGDVKPVVLLNTGNDANSVPQFSATSYTAVYGGLRSITVGDLNGDNKPDFIVGSGYGALQVYLNNGDGTFTAGQAYSLTPGGSAVGAGVIADFNGDDNADYLVTSNQNSGANLLIGNGNGTFQAPVFVSNTPDAYSIAVDDLNGDGKPDFVVGNTDGTVGVFLNSGGGSFIGPTTYSTVAGGFAFSLAIADMNGDGKLDVVACNFNSNGGTNGVAVLLGNGNGTLGAPTTYTTNQKPFQVFTGDFNGDGKPDIETAAYNSKDVGVLLNTTVLSVTCTAGSYLASPGDTACTPAPAGSFVSTSGATSATLCPVGTFSSVTGAVACTAAPAGWFVAAAGSSSAALCPAGSYSASAGSASCALAPTGYFVGSAASSAPTACSPGTYADTFGAVACTPAPAGSYVPNAGASSAIACPAGYGSNVGATLCFALDTDGDGVNNDVDAYPNSNMSAFVSVAACTTGVTNRVTANGATFNDLIAAALGGGNHGANVRAVSQLSNGWKSAGLISGRDHGAIVSCTAKSK